MKYLSTLLLLFLFFAFPTNVFAHVGGVPIFKINNEYTKPYPPQLTRTTFLNIPENADLAPQNYLVGQSITFELETDKLQIPKEVMNNIAFTWDFGDGTTVTQTGNPTASHEYKKMGTYIMLLYADYKSAGFSDLEKQVVQATVLNILPSIDYQLPKAVITANGQASNYLQLDFSKKIVFDASSSTVQSANTAKYEWDFHDGEKSVQKRVEKSYGPKRITASPILRVTDANGFFADSIVTIEQANVSNTNSNPLPLFIILNITVLIVSGITIFVLLRKPRKKK